MNETQVGRQKILKHKFLFLKKIKKKKLKTTGLLTKKISGGKWNTQWSDIFISVKLCFFFCGRKFSLSRSKFKLRLVFSLSEYFFFFFFFVVNTMFRQQAFLWSQYLFICVQYFKCSDTWYTQYFIDSWSTKQLVVRKTLFLFWWRKLVSKKFVKKWKTT